MSEPTWPNIKRLLNAHALSDYVGYNLDDWERGASRRITRALVDGMHAEARYQMDVVFHRAIDNIAALAAAAVFNEVPLTSEEVEQRRVQFETLGLTVTPFGLSPNG